VDSDCGLQRRYVHFSSSGGERRPRNRSLGTGIPATERLLRRNENKSQAIGWCARRARKTHPNRPHAKRLDLESTLGQADNRVALGQDRDEMTASGHLTHNGAKQESTVMKSKVIHLAGNDKKSRTTDGKLLSSRLSFLMLLIFSPALVFQQNVQSQQESHVPLEIRLSEPLRWENGCLVTSLDRINRSSSSLFLPNMGPYFDIALDVSGDGSQSGDELAWVNIFGIVDMRDTSRESVAPGALVHNAFCFGPTVWVSTMTRHTRREISVRGKMRISVLYFLSEEDSKRYHKFGEVGPLGRPQQWITIFADIPCPKSTCESDCNKPPIGIRGEVRMVPDAGQFFPEILANGEELTNELSRKFPPCSGDKSNPKRGMP
jgi:hypothetical protein